MYGLTEGPRHKQQKDCPRVWQIYGHLNDCGNAEPVDPAEFDEYGCIDRNPFLPHLFYSTETDYLDRSDFELTNPIKVKCCDENSVIQDSTDYGRRGQKETLFTTEDEFCERRLFSSPKLEEVEYLGVKPSFLDSPVSENNDYYNLKPVVVDLTGIELPVKSASLLNTLSGKSSLEEPIMCSSSIKTEVGEDVYSNSKNSIFELNEQKLYDISEIVPVEEFLPNQFMETVKQETQDNHAENEAKQVKSKGRKTRKKKRKKSNLLKKNNAKNTSRKKAISKNITEKTKEQNETNGDCTRENNGTKVTENKQYWWNALQRYNFRPRDKLKNNSIQTQEDILNEMLGFESDSTIEDNVIESFGMRPKKQTSQGKMKITFNRSFVKEEIKNELGVEESEFSINKHRKPQAKRGRKKKENDMHESKDSVEFANTSPYQPFQEKHPMKANVKHPIIHCKKEYSSKEVKPTLKTDFKWCPNVNYDYLNHENGSNNKISYCTRSKTAHEGSYKSTSNYFEDYEVNWDQFTFSNSADTNMANPKFMKDEGFVDKRDKYSNTFTVNYEEDYDGKTMKIFSNKKFKCDECIYSSDRRSKIEQHKLKHAMGMEYRCHFCHFVSSYNREFYRHMETHYEGPPYRCEHAQCNYVSCRISTLLVHCVMHSNVRGYKCHLCSYSCKRKYHLKGHMVTHSSEKQFLCSFCQKKYKHKCSLVRHLLRHEGRVKYKY
nr:uncharacterized protein LOC107453882 [Parasteatoda tepidariorum]